MGIITKRINGNLYEYYRDSDRHETYLGKSGSQMCKEKLRLLEQREIIAQIDKLKIKLGQFNKVSDNPETELLTHESSDSFAKFAALDVLRRERGKYHGVRVYETMEAPKNLINGCERAKRWYLRLKDRDVRTFTLLVAMFPLLPLVEYDRIYAKISADTFHRKFEEILPEISQYIGIAKYKNLKVAFFWTEELRQGILSSLNGESNSGRVESVLLADRLIDLIDHNSTRLEATNWLRRFALRSPFGTLKAVHNKFEQDRIHGSRYKKHMIARILSELIIESEEVFDELFEDFQLFLDSEGGDSTEAAFILKTIVSRKRGRNIAQKMLRRLFEVGHEQCVARLVSSLERYVGNINNSLEALELILQCLDTETSETRTDLNMLIRNAIQKLRASFSFELETNSMQCKVGKNLIRNSCFRCGLEYWHPTGDAEDAQYQADSSGRYCHAIERNEDNLGRLFQDLTCLLHRGLIRSGQRYKLKAAIKTNNVFTTHPLVGGATIGISYVDEAGWTPSNTLYQCELGHITGTTKWKDYEEEFVLEEMPTDCASLYVYFDFNSAKGEAFFSNVTLQALS